jgi:Ser/Thr protein kinase RdoA (MazF antagonist)
VVIHRDLHEKQVMIDGDHATFIDLDTLAVGEAALDIANFLVHLDLRVALGLPVERARATATAFLDAYHPSRAVVERIAAHAAVTRIRLACVYAFRPLQAALAVHLVTARSPGPGYT